jgi:YfiR/HmsC-like
VAPGTTLRAAILTLYIGRNIALRNSCPRRTRLKIVAIVVALCSCLNLHAQQPKPGEYDVKAVYLYSFGKFVRWPAETMAKSGSFPICVLGHDPFGPALDTALAGSAVDGKGAEARRISKPQEALDCRILFVSSSETSRLKDIFAALDKTNILTVSDIPQFSKLGGMIQFVLDGNKIRFEVNLTAAENAGLTLSSELLKVATAVRKNPESGG